MKKTGSTERAKPRARKRSMVAAGALGAGMAYFFDPDRGKSRRSKALDRIAAAFRRLGRRSGRLARKTESDAYAAWQRATHPVHEDPPTDDETLKQKVETKLFGKPGVAKSKIVVNVEDGVVVLRGEVDGPEQMTDLAALALKIPGVAGVQNLLHLPDETPPNKAAAKEASAKASDNK
jgi:HSP20 family molecular chaperone IbpA